MQELEQEKENLTVENEGLTSQIADARADIKLLEEEKIQFQKDKEIAEKRAEKAETELKKLEDRREFLQPVMDNVSKEIKEYGMIKTFLPEATMLERAVTYLSGPEFFLLQEAKYLPLRPQSEKSDLHSPLSNIPFPVPVPALPFCVLFS